MVPVDVANARFDRSVSFVDPDFRIRLMPARYLLMRP
jgi:hypothetical protein